MKKSKRINVFSWSTFFLVLLFGLAVMVFSGCGAAGMIGLGDADFDLFGEDDSNDTGGISITTWTVVFPYAVGTFVSININCGDSDGGDGTTAEGDTTTGTEIDTKTLKLNINGTGTYGDIPGTWIYVSETETCDCKAIYVNEVQVAGVLFTVSGGERLDFVQDENDVWCLVSELEARINDAENTDDGEDLDTDSGDSPGKLM